MVINRNVAKLGAFSFPYLTSFKHCVPSSSQTGILFSCLKSGDLKLTINSSQVLLPNSSLVIGVTLSNDQVYLFPLIGVTLSNDQVYLFPLMSFKVAPQSVWESVSRTVDGQLSAQLHCLGYGQRFKSRLISKSGSLCYSCWDGENYHCNTDFLFI